MRGDLSMLLGFDYGDREAAQATQAATDVPPGTAPPAEPAMPPLADLVAPQEGPMTGREQMITAIRHAFTQARRNWQAARKHEGGLINGLEHWEPPSVAGQIRYRDMRAWVPPGHQDGMADRWGTRYHTWISIPAATVLVFALWVVVRPFRACVAAGLAALTAAAAIAMLIHYGVL